MLWSMLTFWLYTTFSIQRRRPMLLLLLVVVVYFTLLRDRLEDDDDGDYGNAAMLLKSNFF